MWAWLGILFSVRVLVILFKADLAVAFQQLVCRSILGTTLVPKPKDDFRMDSLPSKVFNYKEAREQKDHEWGKQGEG